MERLFDVVASPSAVVGGRRLLLEPEIAPTLDHYLVRVGDRLTQLLVFTSPQRVGTQRRRRILSLLEGRVRSETAPDRAIGQLGELHGVLVDHSRLRVPHGSGLVFRRSLCRITPGEFRQYLDLDGRCRGFSLGECRVRAEPSRDHSIDHLRNLYRFGADDSWLAWHAAEPDPPRICVQAHTAKSLKLMRSPMRAQDRIRLGLRGHSASR